MGKTGYVLVVLLALLIAVSSSAFAQDRNQISIGVSYGAFFPLDSDTRDAFDDRWTRVAFRTFEAEKPTEWRFIGEIGAFRLSGPADVRLIPITFGMERGLRESRRVQPYVTLRAGPFLGRVEETVNNVRTRENEIGLNINASTGVIFSRRFFAEVRYDFFSEIAGHNFDGISLSVGMRLFDIRF